MNWRSKRRRKKRVAMRCVHCRRCAILCSFHASPAVVQQPWKPDSLWRHLMDKFWK